jgi:hypothetical protein
MNELESLTELRISHLTQICIFADKIKRIDERMKSITRDMIVMNKEIDISLVGVDRDAPQHSRYGPRGHAARLVDDLRELEAMAPADLRHYCATPGGSRHNSISRGQ